MRANVRIRIIAWLLVVVFVAGGLTLGSKPAGSSAQGATRYVVLGVNERLPAGFEWMVQGVGGRVVELVPEIGVAVVESNEPSFKFAAEGISGVEAVAEDVHVFIGAPLVGILPESAGPESIIAAEMHSPEHARFLPAQWGLRTVKALDAWAAGHRGHPSVLVAVIDTGIDYTHIDLAGKVDMARSRAFYIEPLGPRPPSVPPTAAIAPFIDLNGHGTHVAGLIAGRGRVVAGVAPDATLIAVKVGGRGGFAPWSAIIIAIRYAADAGADVINMSFGAEMTRAELREDKLKRALTRAIRYAARRGAFVTASAGNRGVDWDREKRLMKIPAQLSGVNGVSATGPTALAGFEEFAPYSDFGRSVVDFAAPGGNVTPFRCAPILPAPPGQMTDCIPVPPGHPAYASSMPADMVLSACSRFLSAVNPSGALVFPCNSGSASLFAAGTSMAAAMVSGVAALVDSVAGGALHGEQIGAILRQTATDLGRRGRDPKYGHGLVNAHAAAECVAQSLSAQDRRAKRDADCHDRPGRYDDDHDH